jgi:hypothetical protein
MLNKNTYQIRKFDISLKLISGLGGLILIASTLLSIAGFLVLRSHNNMLGVAEFLSNSFTDYLYEGGTFFLYLISVALPISIIRNSHLWLLGVGLFSLFLLSKRSVRVTNMFSKIVKRSRIKNISETFGMRLFYISCAVCLIIYCIYKILPSLDAGNLLFTQPNHIKAQTEILRRSIEEGIDGLRIDYENAILYVILSAIAVWGINRILKDKAGKSFSMVCKAILYLLMTVELILLPIKYGESIYSNDFHRIKDIKVTEKYKIESESNGNNISNTYDSPKWLLKENSDYYVIYDGKLQKLILLHKSPGLAITLGERGNIFRN